MNPSARSKGIRTAALALVAVAVFLGCDLGSRLTPQWDLTHEQLFTLSPATTRMLAELPSPVQVELYFSASRKSVPIGLKVFAQRVEQLLRQYEQASDGKVAVSVIDPTPGSRAEEEAKRLGLVGQPLGPDESLYFGLAVFNGGNRRTLPLIDFRREQLMEYDVSRLIQAVPIHRLPKLTLLSSLEVCGARGLPPEQRQIEDGTAEWQFVRDLRVSYDVQDVNPANETFPANTDVLLVINPAGFNPRLVYAIDQYVLSGRPAVVLVDPYEYHEVRRDETDGNVIGASYAKASDLPALFAAWGLQFSAREVIADLDNPTIVPVQENRPPVPFPFWVSLSKFDDTLPITAGFDSVMLAHAGWFTPAPRSAIRFTPLLRSSPRSAAVPADQVEKLNPYRLAESLQPTGHRYPFAALIEGRFATAFPAGKPAPSAERGATGEKSAWDLGLRRSGTTSRVVVIGDADFLSNDMAYATISRRSSALASRPRNNNIALLANSLDYVRGSAGLSAISAKGQAVRPFTRIHDMRRAANAAFRVEAQTLNARLARLGRELDTLNDEATRGHGSIVSEQALIAIRRAQKEQNALRARRSATEERLHDAITSLDRRLTALNLAVVPLLIAVAGIVFWSWRTRRRSIA